MRTKTLLLTVALGGAMTTAALAQPVYSQNVVGYVNVTIPSGFSIIANPLDSGENRVADVIQNAPPGFTLYKFSQAGYEINAYEAPPFGGDAEWADPDQPFAPGEGAFVLNPEATPVTITFVGEVKQGALLTPLPAGFSLVGSQVPQSGLLQGQLEFPAADGDAIYRFRSQAEGYLIHSFAQGPFGGDPEWDEEPVIAVGEGFFVLKANSTSWTRNFSVN